MPISSLKASSIKNKVVILRTDFNVSIEKNTIIEDTRIQESLPTIKFLLENEVKQIHILSHLGRPEGKKNKKYSLEIVAKRLESLLKQPISFREEFSPGRKRIQLHENIRFYPGEKTNDPKFIHEILKTGGEVFVNDGFAVCHRPHASVIGVASYLPSYPGILLQKEIDNLSPYIHSKKITGCTTIIGGKKLETKIPVIKSFANFSNNIIIGGMLAQSFLRYQGFQTGKNFTPNEENQKNVADILEYIKNKQCNIILPVDFTGSDNNNHPIVKNKIPSGVDFFDIGKESQKIFAKILEQSERIIWNGPMGKFEDKKYENGTKTVLKSIAAQKTSKTILGGGDTLEAINRFGVRKDAFTHVSTGGGAMLKFLEGEDLPGIEALNKE